MATDAQPADLDRRRAAARDRALHRRADGSGARWRCRRSSGGARHELSVTRCAGADGAALTAAPAGRPEPDACFGPHRVRITLRHDNVPSTTIEAAASTKKFCAVASCVDSHQPPAPMNTSRAVCASTGPITLAAPCDEKYIDDRQPDEGVHRRRRRQILLAGGAHAGIAGEDVDPEIREDRDEGGDRADRKERDEAGGPGDPPRARDPLARRPPCRSSAPRRCRPRTTPTSA